jgi:hypothetical protein
MTRGLMLLLLLGGCATQQAPIYVTQDLPEIPLHCDTAQRPTPKAPTLPDEDITDLAAAKDRLAFKQAHRIASAYRSACYEELRVLLREQKKPTS